MEDPSRRKTGGTAAGRGASLGGEPAWDHRRRWNGAASAHMTPSAESGISNAHPEQSSLAAFSRSAGLGWVLSHAEKILADRSRCRRSRIPSVP